jgi:threonine dehydrogenase-like Zn-dependent dehydrogenase
MNALTFRGKRTVRFESVPDPEIIEPNDALVRVRLSAVCGSDLHVYHERETGLDGGTVMGHEFVGEIVETGAAVSDLQRGERVACPFTTSCGSCFYCREGLTSRCTGGALFGWVEGGRGLHGAQAEYVRVPLADSTLVPVPETVHDEEALLLGDVLPTGWFCAELAGVRPGGVYAVLGCGPVGLMAIVGAVEQGAERVFAVDPVPERLALARDLGATPVPLADETPRQTLEEATEGRGADAVLEVVGSPEAGRLAYELVRPGGTIAVVGVHNEPGLSFSPAEAYDKNLTYRVGRCPARRLMTELLPLLEGRRYNVRTIVSHRMALSDGARAYDIFDRKQDGCTKVLLSSA